MKIAIVGAAGRMGQKLCELAKGTELEVVSKVDVAEGYDKTWAAGVEGVIDFSYHTGVPASIAKAASEGIPYVIGTTGITAEEQKSVDAAAKVIPVVQSGNYSLGVNLLMERAGLPGLTTAPEADPANNMGVSNLLWEIRRQRRCELMFDNWTRYWDLVRWHQLELLDSNKHPNIYKGANLSKLANPEVDVAADGYMIGSNTINQPRAYDKKYYFYPVPSGQITLNPQLDQNPGWK